MPDIALYNNGEIELKIPLNQDTIWLTQKQIAMLFDKDVRTINDHIKTVFKDEELDQQSTIRKFRIVQKEGNKEVSREIKHYNLDMIISVGYKTNSKKATKFRQWATTILRDYILNGFAINREKITQQRLLRLENDVSTIKQHIQNHSLELKQGIFFDGEIFDAYAFVSNLIKSAKSSIKLIDNYIDDSVLVLLSKNQNVKITIYTKEITKQLKLDLQKYNLQYNKIEAKEFKSSHDRFLIIDDKEIYHVGASLKDLGKK